MCTSPPTYCRIIMEIRQYDMTFHEAAHDQLNFFHLGFSVQSWRMLGKHSCDESELDRMCQHKLVAFHVNYEWSKIYQPPTGYQCEMSKQQLELGPERNWHVDEWIRPDWLTSPPHMLFNFELRPKTDNNWTLFMRFAGISVSFSNSITSMDTIEFECFAFWAYCSDVNGSGIRWRIRQIRL